ncbi:MAG: stage III sporulation protein AF [Peptococcales bacterium]
MLQALSDIVKNVAIIILLTTFLDMLLPNTSMQRFIKVVMGLFVMLAILNPIVGLFKENYELSAWQLTSLPEQKVETVLAQGEKIVKLQEEQALVEYISRIEKQIEALVKLVPGIGNVSCKVEGTSIRKTGAIAKIEKAIIWVTPEENVESGKGVRPVEPVRIQIDDQSEPIPSIDKHDKQVEEKIINVVANYYNISKENIEIIFY